MVFQNFNLFEHKNTLKNVMSGLTIVQNNFYGQAIKHYHIHLIPRYENDGVNMARQENKKEVENIHKELTE